MPSEPCKPKFWRHFALAVFGGACVVVSAFVPAAAPLLGPIGAKVLAGVGLGSILLANPAELAKGPRKTDDQGAMPDANLEDTPRETPSGKRGI